MKRVVNQKEMTFYVDSTHRCALFKLLCLPVLYFVVPSDQDHIESLTHCLSGLMPLMNLLDEIRVVML